MEHKQVFVQMALQAWNTQINRTGQLFNRMEEEQLLKEIAPGKNRGIYIIGHLIAIHDAVNEILGLGGRAYAGLDAIFVQNPDKAGFDVPSIEMLKQYWDDVHQNLSS
ncbi:MAG: hypothetical protein JWQ09_3161, partial [Segetibacter sp.]|nr:hypothetical protein [Segetibacter sp.]